MAAKRDFLQVGGHGATFKILADGNIEKETNEFEVNCYQKLKNDALTPFVPPFIKSIGGTKIVLGDLNRGQDLALMDCKLGVRDDIGSSRTLGFRIEGIKMPGSDVRKGFENMKGWDQVQAEINKYTGEDETVRAQFVKRLEDLKAALGKSKFFAEYEVAGSSLLFKHDSNREANVWMLDFGETTPMYPGQKKLSHDQPWKEGSREDGYLIGLNNLIKMIATK